MSNEAPEKVYHYSGINGTLMSTLRFYDSGLDDGVVTYIREDLVQKQDHIPDAEKMVEQRRREMFEKVFVACIASLDESWTKRGLIELASELTEYALEAADKFAKGE